MHVSRSRGVVKEETSTVRMAPISDIRDSDTGRLMAWQLFTACLAYERRAEQEKEMRPVNFVESPSVTMSSTLTRDADHYSGSDH